MMLFNFISGLGCHCSDSDDHMVICFLRIGDTFVAVVATIAISIATAVVLRIVVSGTIVIANTTVAIAIVAD